MRGRDRAVQNSPCIGGLVPPIWISTQNFTIQAYVAIEPLEMLLKRGHPLPMSGPPDQRFVPL